MNPIDLLKLAEQAENEGRYAIADKLTNRAIKIAAALPMVYDSIAAAQAAARGAEESLGRAGVEGLGRASDEAAARYLGLAGDEASAAAFAGQGGGFGNVNLGTANATSQVAHGGQNTATQMARVDAAIENIVKQEKESRNILITIDGVTKKQSEWTTEEVRAALEAGKVDPKSVGNANNKIRLSDEMKLRNKQRAELRAEIGQKQKANATPTSTQSGAHVGGDVKPQNTMGKSNMVAGGDIVNNGVSNAALLGGMGIVGVTGALGILGMYLGRDGIVRDRDNVVVAPQNIPADIARRLPRYQMMTRREEAGQLGGQRALNAQNFVDSNASNPRLKNQRDWYNLALQTSGGDKNFANNVITYVKASPEMPSQIGGGPNI